MRALELCRDWRWVRRVGWLCLALAACSSSGDDPCAAHDDALQHVVDTLRGEAPDVILAVKNEDCGARVYMSGDATTASRDSLWRVMSVTKTFVSAAVLSLVDEGVLSLDDPLSRWVPNVPYTDGVTIETLLDHRSGLRDIDLSRSELAAGCTPRQIVDIAASQGNLFAADAEFNYSNTNYILLGMILEAATGKSVTTVLHERAIDRAGLHATYFDGGDGFDAGRLARGFHGFTTYDRTFWIPASCLWTAGAMVMSAADVAEWVARLYGSDDVLDETGHARLSSRVSEVDPATQYGLGVTFVGELQWRPYTPHCGRGIGHAGGGPGYLTAALYFPDHRTSVVTIVNDDTKPTVVQDVESAALAALFR